MLHHALHDVRYAWRTLLKTPGFAPVAVLTLALGIGANTAIFSVVHALLLKPLPYPGAERMVLLAQDLSARGGPDREWTSPGNLFDWKAETSIFESMTAVRPWQPSLSGTAEPEPLVGEQVTSDYFDVVGVTPALGRRFAHEDDIPNAPRVVVLAHGLWQRRFGSDPRVIGRLLTLGGEPHEVIGVMPAGFRPAIVPAAELWRPLRLDAANPSRGLVILRTLARLRSNVSQEDVSVRTRALAARLQQAYPEAYVDTWIAVVPLQQYVVGDIRDGLIVLLCAVGVVLLIACVNIANLLLARGSVRGREIAIRMTLGAARGRVVRQLLTESILLACIGGAVGVLLAVWAVDALVAIAPPGVPRLGEVGLDRRVLAFAVVLTFSTGIAFGLVPAFHASRQDFGPALKETARAVRGGGGRARRTLIVAEIALALVLLVGGGLLLRTFMRLQAADLGFDPSHVVAGFVQPPAVKYRTPAQIAVFYDQLLERASALPGVKAAALASVIPLGGDSDMDFQIEGRPQPRNEAEAITSWYRLISPGYFDVMRIRLVKGRVFALRDPAPSVVVNESFARKWWPDTEALGRRLRLSGRPDAPWFTVVGVVGDVKVRGARAETRTEMYVPYWQLPEPGINIVLKATTAPGMLVAPMKQMVRQIDPDLPVSGVTTMDEVVAESIGRPRFLALLTAAFAGLAAILAAVGIYGVMSHMVTQRTAEIGVRMALGATTREVFALVVRDGLRLASAGIGCGVAAALVVTRLISSALLFEVQPRDPWTFGITAALLFGVALAAGVIPASRAMKVDPMVALRAE